MASPTEITVSQLSRLIGLPDTPAIIDVHIDEDFAFDPRLTPGSRRGGHQEIGDWAPRYADRKVIVVCHRGQKPSQGVAAPLRHDGIEAETLEGGFEAWAKADQPGIIAEKLPQRDAKGRTPWVTEHDRRSTASPAPGLSSASSTPTRPSFSYRPRR